MASSGASTWILAAPAGDWFMMVHSCSVPSPLSSTDPAPTPPSGTAERIPEGGEVPAKKKMTKTGVRRPYITRLAGRISRGVEWDKEIDSNDSWSSFSQFFTFIAWLGGSKSHRCREACIIESGWARLVGGNFTLQKAASCTSCTIVNWIPHLAHIHICFTTVCLTTFLEADRAVRARW